MMFLVARDYVGIVPLHLGRSAVPELGESFCGTVVWVASELKCLVSGEIERAPGLEAVVQTETAIPTGDVGVFALRDKTVDSCHLMSDDP